MKINAKVDYMNQLTAGDQYEVVAIMQTDLVLGDYMVTIANNNEHDIATYSLDFFFDIKTLVM